MATGNNLLVGFKKHTNTWGYGAAGGAVACVAGDGLEVDAEAIRIEPTLVQNRGLSGSGTRLPSTLGNKLVSGDLGPCPLYYRGLEVPIALAMGTAVAPAQQGATAAYSHQYNLKSSHAGLYGTLALPGADHPAVREIPHAKIGGFTFDFTPNELARVTFPIVGFDMFVNEGSPDTDYIVTSAPVADGVFAIAAQPTAPTFLTITVTDADASVTEFIVTFVGADENGDYQTETYQLTVDTKVWTSKKRWSALTSVTGSGLTGTAVGDTIVVGILPGMNNASTISTISLPSTADHELVRFDQVRVWANAQSGADFVAGDEIFVDSVRIALNLALRTDKVTTRYGNRIDQPNSNDFKSATIGFRFPEWDSDNVTWLQQRLKAGKQKVKVTVQGPLADTGYPLEVSFFLNNVQFTSHGLNVSGPGEIGFDLEGEAHRALAAATGAPAWSDLQPISVRIMNLRTTSALA